MWIISYVQSILTEPVKFFGKHIAKDHGFWNALRYLMAVSLFGIALTTVMNLSTGDYVNRFISSWLGVTIPAFPTAPGAVLSGLGIDYAVILLGSFVLSFFLYGWCLLLGGKASWAKTYQIYVYARTPGFVIGWIPFLSFFTWAWTLYLFIVGTHKVHGISMKRAVLMYVIPLFVWVLAWRLVLGYFGFAVVLDPTLLQTFK